MVGSVARGCLVLLATIAPRCAVSQTASTRTEELALFVSGAPAGRERIATTTRGDGVVEEIEIALSAGPGVTARVTLERGHDFRPRRLEVSGKTLPWLPALASWPGTKRGSAVFPIAGSFPIGVQVALVRYWNASGRPAEIRTTQPTPVVVSSCGVDTVRSRALACYEVAELAWGRSILWFAGPEPDAKLAAAYVPTVVGKVQALAPDWIPHRAAFLALAARGLVRLGARVSPVASASARPIVIRGGDVVDVDAGRLVRGVDVVLQGDSILGVGRPPNVRPPAGATVIDARGMSIIPGLWDMHAHLRHAEWAPAYLATGITSVRDVGNDSAFVGPLRRIADGMRVPSPRITLAGWIDAAPSPYPEYQVASPDEGRALVRRYRAQGFEQIKVWENIAPDVARAVVDEAHRAGMRVTGHIPETMTLLEALAAGVDQIEHVDGIVTAVASAPDSLRSMERLARHLAARGVAIDPTLVVAEFHGRDLGSPLATLEPGVARVTSDMAAANELLRGPASQRAQGARAFAQALAMTRALHAAGVPLVTGSDQGVPGFSLLHELELFVLAGLKPIDALRASTIVPARLMGRSATLGAVRAGMRADLVILRGNPLDDIRAIRNTQRVVRGGDVYDPAALRRGAGFPP
jgi:imidazolonepropionase-like amidohydrolase